MNAKLISRGIAVAIIFVLALSAASSSFAKGRGNSPESPQEWFKVTVMEMTPNVDDGTSTWTYQVEEMGSGKGFKDLSHWVLGLEDCYDVIRAEPEPYEVGKDPRTGVYGIKWEVDDSFESGVFTVTVNGVQASKPVKYATKAGRYIDIGETTGPSCDPYQEGDEEDPGV